MSAARATVLLRGRRVYADSIKTKELSPGGAAIVYCDAVEPFSDDWDRNERPREVHLTFNGPGADRGPRQ
ncbi:MAG TPA: hypothetical protein VGH28_14030 [Polyangiaceae bacterium]